MKKRLFLLSAAALFFVGLSSMVMMDPPDNAQECKEICAELIADGIFSGQGACQSACNTCLNPSESDANSAVCICHQIRDIVGLEEFGFKNFGECVKAFK